MEKAKRLFKSGTLLFCVVFIGFFALLFGKMGCTNAINTMMNTAYRLLLDTAFYLVAVCVLMGAISALLTEFGIVRLFNILLSPLMKPVYGLPGAASLGVVATFFSDNPAILTLAEDSYFKSLFRPHQLAALNNLGTSFGMGLIVCAYMVSLQIVSGESYMASVVVGLLGVVVGSIISTRLMLHFARKAYADSSAPEASGSRTETASSGGFAQRMISALLSGGSSGLQLGMSIIPGVLIICTIVMMLSGSPSADGQYTGAAYEGIALLPLLAERLNFILQPLFGFSSPEALSVPITALGSAGAAIGVAGTLVSSGLANGRDVAVFTAMCMCWSGYLSTHISMMNALHCDNLTGKAILSHTIGGICAGIAANWIYRLAAALSMVV